MKGALHDAGLPLFESGPRETSGRRGPEAPPPPSGADARWPEPPRVSKLDQRFWEFHESKPEVYQALAEMALAAVRQGKKKVGAKALFERVRWELWLASSNDDEYQLNNNHTSRYARLLMARVPELRGVFELRGLRS